MKLSICMMIKNEEKNLQKCLDSLQPLLKELTAELIIVDTGSADRSIEIAEQYTDRLYFHDWNDDFSAMRNITINYARGEWILIVDGDEVVENCSNMISFLKSKQSRKFNTAVVSVKNFVLSNIDDSFSVVASPRLFRNDGSFRYEGAVHNQPVCREPGIRLQTTFLHYGYINDDPELMERKFQRTSKILLANLEKDPDDVYYHFQLSVSYKMHHDYREALTEIKKAYELIKDNEKEKIKRIYIYQQLAACYLLFAQFEKACEYCWEGLKLEKEYIDLWYYLGDALRNLEQYEESIKAFLQYADLVKNYATLEISKNIKIEMHLLDYLEEAYSLLAFCYVKTEDYNSAFAYLKQITAKCKNLKTANQLMAEVCLKLGKFKELKQYFIDIVLPGNQELLKGFIRRIETEGIKLSSEEKIELLKQFAAGQGSYADLNKIRLAYATGDELLKDMLTEYICSADFNFNFDFSGDIFYYLLDLQYPAADFFARIEEKNIEIYLNYILRNYNDTAKKIQNYLEKFPDETSLQWVRTNKILSKYAVMLDKDLSEDQYLDYFKKYITNGIKYINLVYNPGIIENKLIYELKNDEEKFLLYLYKAELCKNNNEKEYISYLVKAGNFYPLMKKGVDLLIKEHQEKEKARKKEMKKLQNQVKANIEQLINQGLLEKAKNLISEYKSMVEDDTDIYSMQAVILITENKLDEAGQVLKQGLALDNSNFDLLYNLGYLYELTEKKIEALSAYKLALNNCPDPELMDKIGQMIYAYEQKHYIDLKNCMDINKSSYDSKNKVLIAGINQYTEQVVRNLDYRFEIAAYIAMDASRDKIESIEGIKIIAPEEIHLYQYDYIIVSQKDEKEIAKSTELLLKSGISRERIFPFYRYYTERIIEGFENKLSKFMLMNKAELVLTGLSYGEVGIDVQKLNQNSINFALSSQDLFYDYRIMKYLLNFENVRKNLRYAILNLAYYSFDYDLSLSPNERKRVHRYYSFLETGHHYNDKFAIETLDSIYHKNRLGEKYEELTNTKANIIVDASSADKGKKYALHHANMNNSAARDENISIFKSYMELLNEFSVKPIIVVCPVSEFYYKHYLKASKERFYKIINEIHKTYDFQFLDYFDSPLFELKDFWDDSHLNCQGRDKFTDILADDIVWS